MQSVDLCWVDEIRAVPMGSVTEVTWKLYHCLKSALGDLLLING